MSPASRADPHSSAPGPAYPRNWRRIGLWLVAATMTYNVLEGAVAVWAGLRAGSIALVGFGLDSYIECAAAAALFWRLGRKAGERIMLHTGDKVSLVEESEEVETTAETEHQTAS